MSIKVGDLVMIVKSKPCCGGGVLGYTFYVSGITVVDGICAQCGAPATKLCARDESNKDSIFISRLIKIDPPSLPESLEREKELSV